MGLCEESLCWGKLLGYQLIIDMIFYSLRQFIFLNGILFNIFHIVRLFFLLTIALVFKLITIGNACSYFALRCFHCWCCGMLLHGFLERFLGGFGCKSWCIFLVLSVGLLRRVELISLLCTESLLAFDLRLLMFISFVIMISLFASLYLRM